MDPAKLKAVLRTEIDNVARSKALQGYEIPREFIIETRPFSKDNHLLTDSNKPARGQLKKRCLSCSPAIFLLLFCSSCTSCGGQGILPDVLTLSLVVCPNSVHVCWSF
jgi:hypothetical protein